MQTLRPATGCTRCPSLVANRHRIVHGYGAVPARVMFIGEAPGYKGGDQTGVPFTRDRSGVRLQRMLIELGLSLESDPRAERPRLRCFVTNIVRCNPPGNRTPTRTEIANCLPYLWQEMEQVQPEIIVPIGNIATRAILPPLLGQAALPIGRIHAHVLFGEGIAVIPLRHPSRISNADMGRFIGVIKPLLARQAGKAHGGER